MSNTLKFFILMLVLASCAQEQNAQEMSFEDYNPPATIVVPKTPTSKAKFPFVDIHSHQFRMATQDLSGLIADMDAMNMGVMVNLSGGSGENIKNIMTNINEN